MAADTSVTSDITGPDTSPNAQTIAAEPESGAAQAQPEPANPQSRQRDWSMPTSPISREQAAEAGRIARNTAKEALTVFAGVARYCGRMGRQLFRAIEAIPSMLRLLTLVALLMLLGIFGAIASHSSLGLICIVVVIPVSSITLGALGHRWYGRLSSRPAAAESPEASLSDLQRSIEYVDTRLTFALNSFGAERHQHAMIALFQAKTAVELTLGTERDPTHGIEALLSVDNNFARPRIRPGTAAKSLLQESNSLAAS
ncbi:MAG: hypothetical protein HYZ38_23155 [Mycobacterium sp.]|nr:hypothetical protein [Mycobacterium sp.]